MGNEKTFLELLAQCQNSSFKPHDFMEFLEHKSSIVQTSANISFLNYLSNFEGLSDLCPFIPY